MIEKFTALELKTLITRHGSCLVHWAQAYAPDKVDAPVKTALLEISARVHELIEQLPETEKRKN